MCVKRNFWFKKFRLGVPVMQQSRTMSSEQRIFHMTFYDAQLDRVYSASGNMGHCEQRPICPKVAFVLIFSL